MKHDPHLTLLSHGAQNRCFGCGQQNRTGLHLKFFVDEQRNIVCRFRVPRRFEGPTDCVHGGIIATLLDEAMSKANRAHGVVAMTRHMEVDYRRPIPLSTPLLLTARHIDGTGRKHHCEAQIADASGAVLASGKALFIAVDPEYLKRTQR
jgi:uncharacterized protein (TIGR00369 family)